MKNYKSRKSWVSRNLVLGNTYEVGFSDNKLKPCRLILSSPKGFNFLDLETNRCILKNSFFCNDLKFKKIPLNQKEFFFKIWTPRIIIKDLKLGDMENEIKKKLTELYKKIIYCKSTVFTKEVTSHAVSFCRNVEYENEVPTHNHVTNKSYGSTHYAYCIDLVDNNNDSPVINIYNNSLKESIIYSGTEYLLGDYLMSLKLKEVKLPYAFSIDSKEEYKSTSISIQVKGQYNSLSINSYLKELVDESEFIKKNHTIHRKKAFSLFSAKRVKVNIVKKKLVQKYSIEMGAYKAELTKEEFDSFMKIYYSNRFFEIDYKGELSTDGIDKIIKDFKCDE